MACRVVRVDVKERYDEHETHFSGCARGNPQPSPSDTLKRLSSVDTFCTYSLFVSTQDSLSRQQDLFARQWLLGSSLEALRDSSLGNESNGLADNLFHRQTRASAKVLTTRCGRPPTPPSTTLKVERTAALSLRFSKRLRPWSYSRLLRQLASFGGCVFHFERDEEGR